MPPDSWCWRRRIAAAAAESWLERLGHPPGWTLTGKPGGLRPLLAVYVSARPEAERLHRAWGGEVRRVPAAAWATPRPAPPLRLGRLLEVIHEEPGPRPGAAPEKPDAAIPRLHIPLGLAFGSGEHATTAMLLRSLARVEGMNRLRVLDLGTGSGILALAARLFGATRIAATDFDPAAIRTARQNEALNFSRPLVRWRRADVRRLRAAGRYDLVLANLFSGLLCAAAVPIAASVAPGGKLWLSGILRAQEKEVIAAYRPLGLRLLPTLRRGKWTLLPWQKPSSSRTQL